MKKSLLQLFDARTISTLPWPETTQAKKVQTFFSPFFEEKVTHFIPNVETKLYLLLLNQWVIPLTANTKEYENSYLTSNYFPIVYLKEACAKKYPKLAPLLHPCIDLLGLPLKAVKINQTLLIHNTFLSTALPLPLSAEEQTAALHFLKEHFPKHALFFRNLNTRISPRTLVTLRRNQCRLYYARHIFYYDPKWKESLSSKVQYHHRRDRRLIQQEGYQLVRNQDLLPEDIPRLHALYQRIYLQKYTRYSPCYTEKFIKHAIATDHFSMVCLKREGRIDGFLGFYSEGSVMSIPFFGYDDALPHSSLLYRMLTQLGIDEAELRHALLNDGSGGSSPKKYRGMKQAVEFVALYDRHLPLYRRLFWALAEMVTRFLIFPLALRKNRA